MEYNEKLKQNRYPNYFISAKNRLQQMIEGVQPDRENKSPNQNILSIKIPFDHHIILNKLMSLKKRLCNLIPEFNSYIITTCFRAETIVSKYKSDLIYKFQSECKEASCIGQTGLALLPHT